MKRTIITLVVLLCCASAVAQPSITFETHGASVAGIGPGSKAMLFALLHEQPAYNLQITGISELLRDEDRDGVVRRPLGRAVPGTSVWIAADVAQGSVAAASPRPERFRRGPLGAGVIRPAADRKEARLVAVREFVAFIVVRPRVGAWSVIVDDGTTSDGDLLDDGNATALLSKLRPLGDSPPPPAALTPGDTVVAIDLRTLEVFDRRLTE